MSNCRESPSCKPRMLVCLKLCFGLGLLFFLLLTIDWRDGVARLESANLTWILWAPALVSLGIFLSVLKWKLFLRASNILIKFHRLVIVYFSSLFFTNFLPSSAGGDVVRMVMLRRFGSSVDIASSIVAERFVGVVVVVFWSALALYIKADVFHGITFDIFKIIVLLFFSFLVFVFLFSDIIEGALLSRKRCDVKILGRLVGFLKKISISLLSYRNNKSLLVLSLIISIFFYLTPIFFQYCIFNAIGVSVSFESIFWAVPLISLVGFLPLSPNSLGLTEGAYVYIYGQLGVAHSDALVVALLARFLLVIVSLVGGVFWVFEQKTLNNE